jgi:hypothetical protein
MCPLIKNNNIFSIFEILLYANNKLDIDARQMRNVKVRLLPTKMQFGPST